MRTDIFDFDLPASRIALHPVSPRDRARLLMLTGQGKLADQRVLDLPHLLRPGDCLVFNDTRVIPAQLSGTRVRPAVSDDMRGNQGQEQEQEQEQSEGAALSFTLHQQVSAARWRAFTRPARKLRCGDEVLFYGHGTYTKEPLKAAVVRLARGEAELAFNREGSALMEAIKACGSTPLPPYIASRRPRDGGDETAYQTIYAKHEGAVAAPTAGLHFTRRLLEHVARRGIRSAFVTLHVGAGTFLPVRAEDTNAHVMHTEQGEITPGAAATINKVRRSGGRVIAVGTTSLRLLETAADAHGNIEPFRGASDLFIVPGYRFRAIDGLLTNFHLPRSTLFMLVCALCGTKTMHRAYAHAIAKDYRFYSYGDACLLFPPV